MCARVGGLVLRARPEPETRNRASPCPSAWTACGLGAQAFFGASAFNANIGAWNTALVSNMHEVCAAPGPAACTVADALGRASMRLGSLCAAASPMRARVRVALGVSTAVRRRGSIHASEYPNIYTYKYVCVCVCVCSTLTPTFSIYTYM